jgi:hypothetical protein
MLIFVLCLLAVVIFICLELTGITDRIISIWGSDNMKLMTKTEFINYIETNDTDCTFTDFEEIDIDDFIQRLELTTDFLEGFLSNYNMRELIASYEFKLIYPNHPLLTKDELFEVLSAHDVDISAQDFEGIDVDDFIQWAYLTKEPEIKNPATLISVLNSYKARLEYQTAQNYNYLFTTEYETLKEEDIPNIIRLYCNAYIGDADGGAFGYWFMNIFDFEKNAYVFPSSGYGSDRTGIYIIGSMHDLPADAFEYICDLLVKNDITSMKQTKFPEMVDSGSIWNLCIELKDGRIIRYSNENKTPKQFSGFARDLYRYTLILNRS